MLHMITVCGSCHNFGSPQPQSIIQTIKSFFGFFLCFLLHVRCRCARQTGSVKCLTAMWTLPVTAWGFTSFAVHVCLQLLCTVAPNVSPMFSGTVFLQTGQRSERTLDRCPNCSSTLTCCCDIAPTCTQMQSADYQCQLIGR